MTDESPSSCRVAVEGGAPAYRYGVQSALRDAGWTLVDPAELLRSGSGLRAIVVAPPREYLARIAELRALCPRLVLVAVLEEGDCETYRQALNLGANGVVTIDAPLDEIIGVVAAALAHRSLLPTAVARALAAAERAERNEHGVTACELDWIRALVAGATVAGLADLAGYSERAMYRRLRDVYCRLGARNRSEALVAAAEAGLLVGPAPDSGQFSATALAGARR
jgi:DNA-binding NarL/FixJ family response regulator